MSLLLKTNIDQKVADHIRGSVARIGGQVNQLIDYENCDVTDINILDGGFGKVTRLSDFKSLKTFAGTVKHRLRQEIAYLIKGKKVQRDRKTVVLDMHFAMKENRLLHTFDASISSNVVEHSPNPLFLLLNFYFITKKDGYQFHAIPNYNYTFDSFRKPTHVDHIIDDFVRMTWFDDKTYDEDYIQSAIVKSGWQKKFHDKYPVAYPFMHYHVFDEHNVRQMAEFMFEDVTVDVIRTDLFGDNVVIFKNKLDDSFSRNYASKIEEYARFLNK
jgi:hypothetical protein